MKKKPRRSAAVGACSARRVSRLPPIYVSGTGGECKRAEPIESVKDGNNAPDCASSA
jgi:hypothetical protein